MKHRAYVFTYNNYPDSLADNDALDAWLHRLGGKYSVAGREVSTTNTPHLQGYIQFANPRSFSSVRKLLTGCHVEPAKGLPSQCRTYCIKDGNFREQGAVPSDPGDREKSRWEDARVLAKKGCWDDIPADIYIKHYSNLRRIFIDALPPVDPLESTCGIWLIGSTGSGKSRGVRLQYPDVYPKPLNKWWDGYSDQESVLLDDVDHGQSSWIGNFLKIWADHYPFIAEKKGGSMLIRPQRVIVTSQYSIEDLFTDLELQNALKRRFNVVNVFTNKPISW